ncbi:MAG: class I SAM-dependent RNA methyltransferase [Betaproteobacteria bacterium]|nr:class I SAM-dependent RNA methyltransferase [Betaproteobacteria bacterium]
MGAQQVEAIESGVSFKGTLVDAYRANLHSRIASRVLWQVARFPYAREQDIYDAAMLLAWPSWFPVACTIKVEINAHHCPLPSLDFITLRVKDAICDKFREVVGSRPSVASREPDIRIHVFLDASHATLYVDLSGEPLFKRGSREHTGAAPLKKNLAAGIIALSGWQPDEPFLDPMCGSGTFLVEAAQIALNIAPGLGREFAFMRLKNFDQKAWQAMCDEAVAAQKPKALLPIFGADLYGYALKDAAENLKANGLLQCVGLKQANVLEISAPEPSGVMVTNPPYGARLGDSTELAAFYPQFGDVLKQRFAGWRAYVFSGDAALVKGIRLSASKRTPLFNGKIECRLYEYKIIAGSNRRERPVTPGPAV